MFVFLFLLLVIPERASCACTHPIRMGLEDGRIQDSQISVSTSISSNNNHRAVRLNLPNIPGLSGGGWRPDNDDKWPWVQVDFKQTVTVTGVITQGRKTGSPQYVKKYLVKYSDDGSRWHDTGKTYTGNTDNNTPKENTLPTPITARHVRVKVTKWAATYCGMRLEFVGCYPTPRCRDGIQLGLEKYMIEDSQISASSYNLVSSGPQYGRLKLASTPHNADGWRAHNDDTEPWLQVDFIAKTVVEVIRTQGRATKPMWVETFKLAYSDDGYNFAEYKDAPGAVPKVFTGNTDPDTVVENAINPTVARYFRIKPLTWHDKCGLRAGFRGCYQDCGSPTALGLADENIIKPADLSASSYVTQYEINLARMNHAGQGGWQPLDTDLDPWLQVDLRKDALISAIATQGGAEDVKNWMITYHVTYSMDGVNFKKFSSLGKTKEFRGNHDQNTVVRQNLMVPIRARFIRIHPKTCKNVCVMRAELYGCYDGLDDCASVTCHNGETCTDLVDSFKCECSSDYRGSLCDLNCPTLFSHGLSGDSISDSQITSSTARPDQLASAARLDGTEGGWRPHNADDKSWLQVDFESTANITAIKTQGEHNGEFFIRSFYVAFGNDGSTFQEYLDGGRRKIFKANSNSSDTVVNYFSPNINARYFRIYPLACNVRIVLRMELYSCFGENFCDSNPCQNNGSCTPNMNGYECLCPHGYLGVNCEQRSPCADEPCRYNSNCTDTQDGSFACECVGYRVGPLCETACPKTGAVGMEDGRILDSQITASTVYNGLHEPSFARLNLASITNVRSGGWRPKESDNNPWLMVQLNSAVVLVGIAMQGKDAVPNYVKTFTVSYGMNGLNFTDYKENGAIKTFTRIAKNSYDIEHFDFSPAFNASYVRVWPKTFEKGRHIRIELYACLPVCEPNPCENNGICGTWTNGAEHCKCASSYRGSHCQYCYAERDLGVTNGGELADTQITASTERDSQSLAKYGRLGNTYEPLVRYGCWCPLWSDKAPWLQVNFTRLVTVSGVKTQGRPDHDEWVTSYQLSFSTNNAVSFQVHQDKLGVVQEYSGNSDRDTIVTQTVVPVIYTQFIRILPKQWNDHVGLRLEFVGCTGVNFCLQNPCLNGGSCVRFTNSYGCHCTSAYTGVICETLKPTTTAPPTTVAPSTITQTLGPDTQTDPSITTSAPGSTTNSPGTTSDTTTNSGTTSSANTLSGTTNSPTGPQGTTNSPTGPQGTTDSPQGPTTTTPASTTPPYTSISSFTLTAISPQEFGKSFSIRWGMTAGTNVTVSVTYNGIPCCSAGPLTDTGGHCDCVISDPNLFDPDGVVNITAVALNLVSRLPASIEVVILKPISGVSFTTLASYSDFGSGLEGRGSQRNVFPAEHPVKFNCSYTGGPVRKVSWTFDCSVDGTSVVEQYYFDKTFASNADQICQISLKLENDINSTIVTGTIELKESVIFTSMTGDGPVKPNQTTTITISLEKLGRDTCMWIDLGDNSSLLVFGDSSCAQKFDVSQINPNIVREPRSKFSEKPSDTREIVITHAYPQVGSYDVRMNASNEVSMVTRDMVVVVLPFVCHNPNVTIIGLFPNSSNVLNASQVYRSLPIALSTENEIYCENTEQTQTTWTVSKFDDDPRVMKTVSVSSLRKTVHRSDISTQDLLLPGKELPYGLYEISARVEMRGLAEVFGTGSLYVQVLQTPWIEAAVVGGSFHTVAFGFSGVLNASASSDPDFSGTDGMSFAWYCRDGEDAEFHSSNLTREPLVSNNDIVSLNTSRGCFGSGRGRINTTNSTLQLDTSKMIEDKTYAILLVLSKSHSEFGLRQAITTVFLHVSRGIPPVVTTSCHKNCRAKVISDEKIILRSNCEAYCTGELTFIWSLYSYDDIDTPEPLNLSALHEVPRQQFETMVLNPITELELAIKPDSLLPGKKYTLSFQAFRSSGVFGELRSTVVVNAPPVGGTCAVSPSSGVALSTNFTFTCEGWTDSDSPLTYKFSYGGNQSEALFYYRTLPSGSRISRTEWLPAGEESSNYTLIVTVKIKDIFGSSSVENLAVQVVPPSGSPSVTEMGIAFNKLLITGDTLAALSIASSLSSTLNTMGSNSSQVREEMLSSLSKMKPQGVSATMQVSGSLLLLAGGADPLTPKAQDAALQVTETLAEGLKNLTKSDEGFKGVKSGATNVLGTLGSLNGASVKVSGPQNKTLAAKNAQRSVDVMGKLQGILLDYLVTNEGSSTIETEQLSINVEKVAAYAFGKKENTLKNCRFKPPSASAFGLGDVLSNPNNTFLQMQPIDIKLGLFDKNPFTWDNSSQSVTSNVVDIVVDSQNLNVSSSNLTEDISVTVPRDPAQFPDADAFYLKPDEMNSTSKTREYLKFHCFTRLSNYTAMNFEIKPEDVGIHYNVFLKKGGKPDVNAGDYESSYKLPDLSTCKVGNDSVYASHSQSSLNESVHIDPSKCTKDPYTVFVSNLDFNGTGQYCFAVQHVEQFHNETYPDPDTPFSARHPRSVSCEVGARRVRRSCVIIPPAPPKPTSAPGPVKILVADNLGFDGKFFYPNQTPNYNMTMFESSCIFWDAVNETWKGEGCRVAVGTNRGQILCLCNHLTSFGSDLLVAPNPIDFDSVFSNFGSLAENVAVLALISTILGVYIIGVIWARRADERDLLMVGPTILQKPKGTYYYLITTATGSRQGAGTTAKVVFTMSGDQSETLPVWLHDRQRPCFERGQTNSFVISYPHGVGDLNYVKIWHDNSGSSPSWYLSRFTVKDLQTGSTWKLICENWLAVESEDGKVCRVLPVANEQELTSFNQVFSKKAIKGLADGHIWFSIVSRPPSSNFTRVQRLSCALCLLCCTMITSAMFYNMGGQGPSPFAVHIGSLVIDLKPFVIGLQSSVIIVPVNVLIVQIFRNLRPKAEKPKRNAVYMVEKDGDEGKTTEKDDKMTKKDEEIIEGVQIENETPPKGKLPHCFIYVAYAICYLASAACIFFTLLYSIQWGKETSTEWVIAMVTSFLQSALLLQPIKVVLAAVVFALCIKKADDSEEEKRDQGLVIKKPAEEKQATSENLAELERKMQAIGRPPGKLKKYYSPPDPAKLQKAREKRLKEIKMNAALKEIFAFFVFLILLMDVAQYHRNPDTFLLTKTLYETFEEVDAYGLDLAAISDLDTLWMWSRETLIPGLYANEWYNGKKLEKGYLANMEDYLVGVPRVRLLRVERDSCPISSYFTDIIPHCYSGYSVTSEEDESYGVGWGPLPGGSSRKRRDIAEPKTENEWLGHLRTYSRGGIRHRRGQEPLMGRFRPHHGELLPGGIYRNRRGVPEFESEGEWSELLVSEKDHERVEIRHKRGLDPIMGGSSGKNRRKKKRLLASAKPKAYIVLDKALLPSGKVLSCLDRWRHQTMSELRGFPYWGTITMYSGSGYVANLGYDQVTAYTVVADLHSNGWLDEQSRAVFVEFTVYNANTNLFGIVSYFIEFPPSSAAVTKSQYQVARFYLHLTGGQTLAHVLVIFFMLYFLYREGKLVYKQRCSYFKGFWNWVEVILIISEFLLIVLFLARLYEVDRNLLQLRENPNDYVGFQYAGNADDLMTAILGVLVFFYILRFLRLLRFNKNFLVIGKTLERISSPILSFCLPFIAGFFAFGLLAFAMFGSELEDYSSFIRTMVTQFSMLLGDFDFEAIFMVNPTAATLYFFSFIGLNVMVLMNMFIAIINDSFAEVQEETAEIQNELEIIDYVTGKVSQGIQGTFHRGKVAPVKKKKRKYKRKSKKLPPLERLHTDLELRCQKLDIFMEIFERSMDEDEVEQQRFHSVPEEKMQDLYFRVLCLVESTLDEGSEEETQSDEERRSDEEQGYEELQ